MKKGLLIFLILVLVGGGAFLVLRPRVPGVQKETSPKPVSFQEAPLANYVNFSQGRYEEALAQKMVLALYFTANWCPICREQEPINVSAMRSLEGDSQILAMRIHILDSETTKETEELARKYGVSYQHTFVILDRNGEVSYQYTGPLSESELKEKITAAKKSP